MRDSVWGNQNLAPSAVERSGIPFTMSRGKGMRSRGITHLVDQQKPHASERPSPSVEKSRKERMCDLEDSTSDPQTDGVGELTGRSFLN